MATHSTLRGLVGTNHESNKMVALSGIKETAPTDQRGSGSQPRMNNEAANSNNGSRCQRLQESTTQNAADESTDSCSHPKQPMVTPGMRGDVHHYDTVRPGSPADTHLVAGIYSDAELMPRILPDRCDIKPGHCRQLSSSRSCQLQSRMVDNSRELETEATWTSDLTTLPSTSIKNCQRMSEAWTEYREPSIVSSGLDCQTSTHTRSLLLHLLAVATDTRSGPRTKNMEKLHQPIHRASTFKRHQHHRSYGRHRRLQSSRPVKMNSRHLATSWTCKPTIWTPAVYDVCGYRLMSGNPTTACN